MEFRKLLEKHHTDKTPVFINGMGVGKIAKMEDDFIDFEVTKEETEGKEKKLTKETTHIPISKIETLSVGEKEIPKSKEDKSMDKELEGI